MNIWTKLGVSVALLAFFCIAAAELLQPTRFYLHHKWAVCVALIISSVVIFVAGIYLNRRIRARYYQAQASLPEQDRDTESQAEPFILFNLAYWGPMVASFGCALVFLVPTYDKAQKAKVAARPPDPPRRKAPSPPPPATNAPVQVQAPVQVPKFRLQGITLREPRPSALINGRTYFVGDFVNGAKVIGIDSNTVILEWRETNVRLLAPR